MKAATGELNLTIITVVALGAVLAFFWFLWPSIKEKINVDWDDPQDPTAYIEIVETNLM